MIPELLVLCTAAGRDKTERSWADSLSPLYYYSMFLNHTQKNVLVCKSDFRKATLTRKQPAMSKDTFPEHDLECDIYHICGAQGVSSAWLCSGELSSINLL